MVAENEMPSICPTKREKKFFRPVADKIENGRILSDGYIFYPYAEDGSLLLTSESALRSEVPTFYSERLRPAEAMLKKRGSRYRKWWEVSRPVATWLAKRFPRLVTQEFQRTRQLCH